MAKKTYTTAEAARLIGISKPTLLYWFKVRRVEDVARDYNGWRVFTDEDIERLKAFRRQGRAGPSSTAGVRAVGAERRQWVRVRVELPVRYQYQRNGSAGAISGESETMDISVGGAMFEADLRELPLGRMKLEIELPQIEVPIAAGAEVRWARRWNDNSLLGVQFVDLHEAQRRLIGDYIGQIAAASS